MDEIAAEAGTSKTVVYRHFADRAELYVAVCNRVASQLLPKLRDAIESSSQPREMVAAAIDTYLAFLEADPELYRFVVHQQAARPPGDRDPISNLSDLVGEQAAAAIVGLALQQAGRDPRGRRALGPRRRRPGPFGRRLVAARRAPHAPHRTRRTPDRSRLGRPVRRRDRRTPEQWRRT